MPGLFIPKDSSRPFRIATPWTDRSAYVSGKHLPEIVLCLGSEISLYFLRLILLFFEIIRTGKETPYADSCSQLDRCRPRLYCVSLSTVSHVRRRSAGLDGFHCLHPSFKRGCRRVRRRGGTGQ